jgi:adenylate cyclase
MPGWVCQFCTGENPAGTRFCGHCGQPAPVETAQAPESVIAGRIGERLSEFGDDLGYERRLVTALFADVSGFTSLADRLDPEQLLEVIDPVISALSNVVRRYEGYIEKFAGDALLALYGAPVAHEDDAARAILTALDMHLELARVSGELPQEVDLSLHVGVNSGHGIGRILDSNARTDYAVLGDCVILAQRLESAAPRGETYVSELTVELTNDRFEFEPVGDLTLKGKSEPVRAWRLVGERQRRASRWEQVRRRLVGRDAELQALGGVFERMADGRGGVVAVTGDAGIGKSRLAAEARAKAPLSGTRWLEARCLSYGADLAYWPYAELLRHEAGIRADHSPHEASKLVSAAFAEVPATVPYFARLLGIPTGESDVDQLEPEEFRRRLHRAFADWLSALAEGGPSVLAIEDIHWADPSTLDLTSSLSSLAAERRLVVYMIGRPEAAPKLREIAPDALHIALGPLSEQHVEVFLESILEGSAPRGLARTVRSHTEGNPFFVEELVRSMQETGALKSRNGVWRLRPGWEPDAMPLNVEGVLAERIDFLPVETADVLHTASVIGRRVPMRLLRAVREHEVEIDAAVDRLVHGGFFDPFEDRGETTLVFHHALVQDVAYSQLLRRERRDLHLLVAEVAEGMYGAGDDTIDLLARHLYLGEAGERAVPYLVRAGERAKALFANDAAILHFGRAAEIAPTDYDVQLELGDLHELVGAYDDALRHFEWVRENAPNVRAWQGAASTLRKQGDYTRALATVDVAFATEGLTGKDLTPLWLENGWTLSVMGEYERALEVFQAGLAAAGSRRDSGVALLLVQLANSEGVQGLHIQALEHALEATAIFEEHEDLRGLATALRVVGGCHYYFERFEEAIAALRRGLEIAERVGSAEETGACLTNLAMVSKKSNDYASAIAYQRRAIEEFERAGNATGRALAHANLAGMLEESGELDEAEAMCVTAQEIAHAINYPHAIAWTTDTLACIELKRGNHAGAGAKAEQAAALYEELGSPRQVGEMLALAAEAWAKAGEEKRARDCSTRARDLALA